MVKSEDINSDVISYEYVRTGRNATTVLDVTYWALGYIFHGSRTIAIKDRMKHYGVGSSYAIESGVYKCDDSIDESGLFEHLLVRLTPQLFLGDNVTSDEYDHRFVNVLAQGLISNMNINELAKCSYSSPSTFKRHFAKRQNTSPHTWLISTRLALVGVALILTDINISELLRIFGFNDTSHFDTLFRRKYGMTPSQFRYRMAPSRRCEISTTVVGSDISKIKTITTYS